MKLVIGSGISRIELYNILICWLYLSGGRSLSNRVINFSDLIMSL